MSKPPHVWVVESFDGVRFYPTEITRLTKAEAKEEVEFFQQDGLSRVAKYVRVEPTFKSRKIRTTTIKLGPAEFIENDCATAYTWTQPKKGRKT